MKSSEARGFRIVYSEAATGRVSPAKIREAMVQALGYGADTVLEGSIGTRAQQAMLKFAEGRKVNITLKTPNRVSRELERRAIEITGRCRTNLSMKMVGMLKLDVRAAMEFSRVGENAVPSGGRGLGMEEAGAEDGDQRMERS